MKTQNRIEELKARHASELREMEQREEIALLLPATLNLPTISNVKGKSAWISFSPDYGTDAKAFALSIFSELEKAGAKPLPLSLCKWGNYRRSVSPGLTTEIPDEKPGCFGSIDKLTDVEPIGPLWIEPCQHTGVEAKAYYSLNGYTLRVAVKAPLQARLSCRRVEYRGGWRFDGACSVEFPQAWHALRNDQGECVTHISAHTRGYRDTEQGISGTIYFQPLTEQESFPLSPAQMLSQLIAL